MSSTSISNSFPKRDRALPEDLLRSEQRMVVKGPLVHPKFNEFCKWFNGSQDIRRQNGYSDLTVATNGLPMKIAKLLWPLYPVFQLFGFVNDKAEKLARAWYGTMWSIVYSGYRPFAMNRDQLTDEEAPYPISKMTKKMFNLNEYFRMVMGTVVSLIYGGGGLGMLAGVLSGNEHLFEKAAKVYKTGMYNQNQVFASMNLEVLTKKALNPNQLDDIHVGDHKMKSTVELIDSVLFIPNIFARALATLELVGLHVSGGLRRIIRGMEKSNYGTWAMRFGIIKGSEEKGGDLAPKKRLSGIAGEMDDALYQVQKGGSKVFCGTLPLLSWISAACEIFGNEELGEWFCDLEGKAERINPMVASWCVRSVMDWFVKEEAEAETLEPTNLQHIVTKPTLALTS